MAESYNPNQPPWALENPAPQAPYNYDWSYFYRANQPYQGRDWYSNYNSIWQDVWNKLGLFNTGAGLGQYDSSLLGDLTGRATSDLNNPGLGFDPQYEKMLYGSMQDRIAAQKPAMTRQIEDQYNNPRLSGLGMSALQNMELGLAGQSADASRQTYLTNADIMRQMRQQAFANAMGLEEMKGGFFENAKKRELGNADILFQSYYPMLAQLLGGQADMMKFQEGVNKDVYNTNYANQLALGDKYNSLKAQQQADWQNYLNNMQKWQWWNQNYGGYPGGTDLDNPWWNGNTMQRNRGRWGGGI